MDSYKRHFEGEEFVISIAGNAPGMINEGLKQVIDAWLNKMGSSVYFNNRKKLILKLNIRRKKNAK